MGATANAIVLIVAFVAVSGVVLLRERRAGRLTKWYEDAERSYDRISGDEEIDRRLSHWWIGWGRRW